MQKEAMKSVSMFLQDRTLQTLMLIGAFVLVLLWNAGVWDIMALWIVIFVALLLAYTALKAESSMRGALNRSE